MRHALYRCATTAALGYKLTERGLWVLDEPSHSLRNKREQYLAFFIDPYSITHRMLVGALMAGSMETSNFPIFLPTYFTAKRLVAIQFKI